MSYDEGSIIQMDGVEVLKSESQISLLAKAEIDSQVATAKAFPRSLKQSLDLIMSMATLTVEIAESCEFALPRGKKADGTVNELKGPSIRLAEIVFSQYGNLRGGARVIFNDGKKVVAQGICQDLQTNACYTGEVARSILQHEYIPDPQRPGKFKKSGRMITMTEDMQIVTGNAACSIAFRNAVFKVVPAAIVQPVYLATIKVALGDIATLEERRKKALDWLYAAKVTDVQICMALGIKAVEDIDLEKMATLRGMCNAIKEGASTVEQLFPKIKPTSGAEAGKAATDATTAAIKKQQDDAAKNKGGRPKKKTDEPAPPITPAAGAADSNKVEPK